jgi:hypothetical protein
MHKFYVIIFVGFLAASVGCRSTGTDAKAFQATPWEDAKDAHVKLDRFRHVFAACIYEDYWEDLGPHRLAPHHYNATVIRSFKGDWHVGERVSFFQGIDMPALHKTNACAGNLVFVSTSEHTTAEIGLDTGDYAGYDPEVERALEFVYP